MEINKIDIDKIEQLIELVTKNKIYELELKLEDGKEALRITHRDPQASNLSNNAIHTLHAPVAAAPVVIDQGQGPATNPVPHSHPPAHGVPPSSLREGFIVTSPMVGTFYKSPSPDASPFVSLGQQVSIGDTLCIIEAMKMLNQIESEKTGTIIAILAENGQPIEFGQPLFIIKEE